jgi:chemotaxis protein CheD
MKKSAHTIDIFLKQGAVYFGDRDTHIRTVLGSCVAVTMWHPELLIGGMCHYMLPTRQPRGPALYCRIRNAPIGFPSRRAPGAKALDGKYADEALELMFAEIQRSGTRPDEYRIKLFGGGNMFPDTTRLRPQHVGLKNIEVVTGLLAHHGLKVSAEHLGGIGHRNLIFDIGSGHVWMRHQEPIPPPSGHCEAREICLHE